MGNLFSPPLTVYICTLPRARFPLPYSGQELLEGLLVNKGQGALPSCNSSGIDGTVLMEETEQRRKEEWEGTLGLLQAAAPCLLPP